MAWKVTNVVESRKEFVIKVLARDGSLAELCREYEISRQIGRKWVKRFLAEGEKGLEDKSRRPKGNSRTPDLEVFAEIVNIRRDMNWGCGVNLRPVLLRKFPEERVPSARTIDRLLVKTGFVTKRRSRRVRPARVAPPKPVAKEPNDIWTIDFKGWWKTQDRRRCEPLTLRDHFTKYLLALRGMRQIRWEAVQEVLDDVFATYGLPLYLRSDNGAPFAHFNTLRGLTQLSAWVVAQGIVLDRNQPGRPDQNGGHERMHKDLKRQLQARPAADLVLQQAAFDQWREHFNSVRPHRSLGMETPASQYSCSSRAYRGMKPDLEYPEHFEVRKVSSGGWIKRGSQQLFVSSALSGWHIGVEVEGETARLWFAELYLGSTDSRFLGKLRED